MPSKKKPERPAKPKSVPGKKLPSDSEHEPAPRKGRPGADGSDE